MSTQLWNVKVMCSARLLPDSPLLLSGGKSPIQQYNTVKVNSVWPTRRYSKQICRYSLVPLRGNLGSRSAGIQTPARPYYPLHIQSLFSFLTAQCTMSFYSDIFPPIRCECSTLIYVTPIYTVFASAAGDSRSGRPAVIANTKKKNMAHAP